MTLDTKALEKAARAYLLALKWEPDAAIVTMTEGVVPAWQLAAQDLEPAITAYLAALPADGLAGRLVEYATDIECKRGVIADHDLNQIATDLREAAASIGPQRAPDGWVLVPVEPTEEMIEKAVRHPLFEKMESWRRDIVGGAFVIQLWQALIAAAPPLTTPGEGEPR
jgi:hypothetical protein